MEHKSIYYPETIKINPTPVCLKICLNNTWIVEFSEKDGIKFNREDFPDWKPDDFANEFIQIFEKRFNIKFIKYESDQEKI
jgi:hypothetical protein